MRASQQSQMLMWRSVSAWDGPALRLVSMLPILAGDALTAAEEYPLLRYYMDAVFWWSRLFAVIPAEQQDLLDASLTLIIALLNLCTITFLVGLGGTV